MQRLIIGLTLLAALLPGRGLQAQTPNRSTYEEYRARRQQAYQQFRQQRQQAYDDFRARRNAEYASYMERRWTAYRTMAGLEEPAQPRPVPPPADAETQKRPPVDHEISVTAAAPPVPAPRPAPDPIPAPSPQPDADRQKFAFTFYGTECRLGFTEQMRFRLGGLSEQQVTQAWNKLSDGRCDALAEEIRRLGTTLRLGDWGYLKLVCTACEAFYGSEALSEAAVLELFLLTQADLKVRAAFSESNLLLLFCPDETLYALTFFDIEGERFYVTDKRRVKGSYRVFDREYPGERSISMRMPALPQLAQRSSAPREIKSARYPKAAATVSVNRNLMDFMTDYPSCRWDMYAAAGMSESLKAQLYPALKKALDGCDEKTAVDMLLDFIQTGLAYKTDPEQFGRERSLFADESCFYPFCDCEDRAILLAVLVRDLVGLDVVLLNYPEHISTAVRFSQRVEGDHFNYRGHRYVCCDPSYIGACAGRSMPDYKNIPPSVITIRE